MTNSNRVQRTDAGNISHLVEAMKQNLLNKAKINDDAAKLLHTNNEGLNGYGVDGVAQPATITGTGIRISDLTHEK